MTKNRSRDSRALKCYFNYNTRSAYSDGLLTASSRDNQFLISGVGFEWENKRDSFDNF